MSRVKVRAGAVAKAMARTPPISPPSPLREYIYNHSNTLIIPHSRECTQTTIPLSAKPTRKRKWQSQINSSSCTIDEHLNKLCREGRLQEALQIMNSTNQQGVQVDSETYASLLQACTHTQALKKGKQVHTHMLEAGMKPNIFLGTKLVIMYSKCGSLIDARHVFDKMPRRNLPSWTAIIVGYTRHGQCVEALEVFYEMQREGVRPDNFIFPSVLKACASLTALEQGREIHETIKRSGFELDVFVGSALVDMYAKCKSIEDAHHVFYKMSQRNVVSWNAMIAGYVQNGHSAEAVKFFRQMLLSGVKPNLVTIASILPACTNLTALEHGKEIHAYIIRSEMEPDVFVGSALVDLYAKCNSIEDAHHVFEKMSQRNVASWNAMIAAYAQNGHPNEALKLFHQMQLAGMKPDLITWTAIIAGFAQNGEGDEVSKFLTQMKLAGMKPNVISWTAIISGYAQNGHGNEALKLFSQMQLEGIKPDVISWNALIAGFAQNGNGNGALKLFHEMQLAGTKPNSVTITSILSACATIAALPRGKEIHDYITRVGIKLDVFVGSALVDMYAKCGVIKDARQAFDKLAEKNVVSWNVMIAGYAIHGYGDNTLILFNQMQQEGMKPNRVTFTGILSACSHAGMVDEGLQYFDRMSQDHHISPSMEHYACMVDLLGRAGHLDEAENLIKKMPFQPNACVWGALLGACRTHCNEKLGERAAEHLFELEPKNSGNYVLLANVYAALGRWDNVAMTRKLMKDRGLIKQPGCSWIEVKKEMHAFVAGDRSHPQTNEIYAMLEELGRQMMEAGFMPDKNIVLYNVEDEQKEILLSHHSEKLAIAFGLINTPRGTAIRVVKNLRICGDCHTAIRFISWIVGREIVVRDANRFHHFKDGQCSCGEYW
eukprot:Gb_32077 [translate_table: standard]